MTTKHTQGPWEASGRYVRTPLTEEGGGWMIADCRDVSLPSDEVRANARLIAAAPELLEALIALRDRCSAELADPEDVREIGAADAAIAKATGDQP